MTSARTLATVKTYCTRFAQLTLTQLTNVNRTRTTQILSLSHTTQDYYYKSATYEYLSSLHAQPKKQSQQNSLKDVEKET